MGVRLYTNIFGTFLPFYLVGVLKLGVIDQASNRIPFTVALVPLIIYSFSVAVSFFQNKFYAKFGRKMALLSGALIGVFCLIAMLFLTV